MAAGRCPAYRRKNAAVIVREIVKSADRGDCERASRLLATNQAMGASECMRAAGFARVARRVRDCWRRMGGPRKWRGTHFARTYGDHVE